MTTSRICDYKFIDVILNLKKYNVKKKHDVKNDGTWERKSVVFCDME